MNPLKSYFEELQQATIKINTIEANLVVYESISFKGTAPGSEESAKRYMQNIKPKLAELKRIVALPIKHGGNE